MGSFAASVDLQEQLRPWALSGLELLFLPGGLPAQAEAPPAPVVSRSVDELQPPAPLAPAAWPAPWSTLAARVRTPPRVIITYAALADDLSGTADPGRRKVFQSVLSYLAWPAGTTLFWPLFLPKDVRPGPIFATDVFTAGVGHFDIRHLLCFGAETADRATLLFPQEGKNPPVVVHRAPNPDSLVSLLPHELQQALAHLKAIVLP